MVMNGKWHLLLDSIHNCLQITTLCQWYTAYMDWYMIYIHRIVSVHAKTDEFCYCIKCGYPISLNVMDWLRSRGSYGNNTLVICCPVPGRPESLAPGTSSHRPTTNHDGAVDVTPDRPWTIPIITWLNNFVASIFTRKYVQNLHQIERRRPLASIVTSRISDKRREL